ncbi:craniofacial development protein 2-like [Scylla paramamosain]|uniref:craniofacial development protein 2-like n=1 Tax=Scylla paramamosain TaxID=85552 RepID=UPI0030832ADE
MVALSVIHKGAPSRRDVLIVSSTAAEHETEEGRSLREKEQFYETLQEMTETIRHHENVIVMGDMNGHVGQNRDGVEHVIGEFSIGERNQEGERIIDYCVMNNMSIMNTYYKHQESHKWTWYRWNAAQQGYTERSMIDLFLTNKKNIFKDVRTIPSVSLDSDHRLVVAKLKIVKPKEKVKKKQKRFKLENLKDEEKKQALRQLVPHQMKLVRE